MQNDCIKAGVIGVGALGEHHVRILSGLSQCKLEGIYDIDGARANEIAQKYRTRCFSSLNDLLSNVQAVVIATPTDTHCAIFEEVAKHGIHALVEKPIASSMSEAEKMAEIAGKNNLILQVGHVERFNPVMQFLEANLTLPRFIEATRLSPYPVSKKNGKARGTEVSVVLDLMIHDIDVILHIVRSQIKDIRAVGIPVLSSTEDIANARIAFENGCIANVTASRISRERLRKIRVFQVDSYLSLDYMNQCGILRRKSGNTIETCEVPIEKGEPLARELADFIEAVQKRKQPKVTWKHAIDALGVAVEICRIIRESPS
jgi:predicted dehydrogenase